MARGTSSMFLTGPDVVEAVTGEVVTIEELGGAAVHEARSGVAHLVADDERHALELVKLLLGYLPQNNNEDPPQVTPYDPADRMDDALNSLIPDDEAEAYDVRDILDRVFDRDSFYLSPLSNPCGIPNEADIIQLSLIYIGSLSANRVEPCCLISKIYQLFPW
jgi:acetyl-CoA carboxylase carboxyltransferase component